MRITIDISTAQRKHLTALVAEGFYADRGEAIRSLISSDMMRDRRKK